jgi:hypothetical protein
LHPESVSPGRPEAMTASAPPKPLAQLADTARMESMDGEPDSEERERDAQGRSSTGSSKSFSVMRGLGSRARLIAGVSIAAVLVLLVIAVDTGASAPVVCDACHEMQPWVASWRVSAHAEVACNSCHGTPRPWYGAPVSVVDRGARLGRDLRAHWTDPSQEVTGTGGGGAAKPIPDAACVQCHNPARVGTSRFGVQIKHAEHAKRNQSCVSCHRWTAHPDPKGDRDSLMMLLCFNCHGLSKTAKAPGRCDECHLKGTDLRPDSHKKGDWLKAHIPVAKADRQQCAMCHNEEHCRDCHRLMMPRPLG